MADNKDKISGARISLPSEEHISTPFKESVGTPFATMRQKYVNASRYHAVLEEERLNPRSGLPNHDARQTMKDVLGRAIVWHSPANFS